MLIDILDYKNRKTEIDVGDLEKIGRMWIEVVTGDEILHVVYKDYMEDEFESNYDRTRDCPDGNFEIYNSITGNNVLNDKKFLERTNYSYLLFG